MPGSTESRPTKICLCVATAAISAPLLSDDYFHLDVLKCDLVVDQVQQTKRALVRHVIAAKFDPGRFTGELRMRGNHLAIEEEGNVGVEFFLQFMKPFVRTIPGPRLVHREQNFAVFLIDRE